MNSQPNTQIILGIISIILISTLLIANIEHPDGNMLDLTTIGIIIIVILVVIKFLLGPYAGAQHMATTKQTIILASH